MVKLERLRKNTRYHEHQYEIDQRGLDVLLGSPLRIPEGELGVSFVPKDLPKAPKREEGCFWEWRHQEVLEVEMYQLESLSETNASDIWVHQVRVGVMEDENKALKLRVRRCAGTIGTGGAYDWPPGGDWVDWLVWSYFPDASVGALKFSPFLRGCF